MSAKKRPYRRSHSRPVARPPIPSCRAYPRCGGCQTLDVPYSEQIVQKEKTLRESLEELIPDRVWDLTLRAKEPMGMRSKASYPLALRRGKIEMGFFERGTHRIVESEQCVVQDPALTEAVKRIKVVLQELKPSIWNEQTLKGSLRHIILRVSRATRELLVIIVSARKKDPFDRELAHVLGNALKQIRVSEGTAKLKGIVKNINAEPGNRILGSQFQTLHGDSAIEEAICGLPLRISAGSFFQVNSKMAERLYRAAIDHAGLQGSERVVDAYCGVGALAILASQRAKAVVGIESVQSAIEDAQENGQRLPPEGARKLEWQWGSVEEKLDQAMAKKTDVLILDPPRAGLSEAVHQTLFKRAPKRLVYVSCSARSFERDVRKLLENDYVPERCQLVDLFPHTDHSELVARFSRRSKSP